ncbi:rab-GTPase-TBC domain-containing protein [Crepidotus variabilis]|uniref:Rab-GTPase-TBC domain-containing protein n=1 Tax=Crepidotus variabilis TaxID=179855 RepID=A0A9P6EUM5_9AGAR|nr:rab-GTPase-TBC domain-containing protein [Crepidotus variabilis]
MATNDAQQQLPLATSSTTTTTTSTTAMASRTEVGHHKPAVISINDFDDDDAFDAHDDRPGKLPYVFSPDAIREDMAKNMPDLHDTWGDEPVLGFTSDGFFNGDDHNTSVSTLDIGPPNTLPRASSEGSSISSAVDSSLSPDFSQISLAPTLENDVPPPLPSGGFGQHPWKGDVSPPKHAARQPARPTSLDIPPVELKSPRTNNDYYSYNYGQHSASLTTPSTSATAPLSGDIPDASAASPGVLSPSSITSASERHSPSSRSLPNISTVQATADAVAAAASGAASGSVLLTEKPRGHRSNKSIGPSTFEKVRSKTRPTFLPPKSRKEDDKHMSDWQHMMKQSRAAAEKKRKAFSERRILREKAIEETLHIWEKEILPNWKVVHKNTELRKLWWRGIPTKLRAPLWEQAVGNDLALSKDHYRVCLSRAKRALASGVFPRPTLDLIEADVETTLPAIHIFHKETGPMYMDLKEMLYAWVVARSDEGLAYCTGAAKVAAMLLINMPAPQAFNVMRNLMERHLMRSFFGGEKSKDDVEAYYRIFDTMLADGMPKIYFNFKQHQISPGSYLPDWIIPLFLNHLPFEACARVWDVIMLEGDSFLYRASLGILGVLEPRLFFPDKKELLDLLKGENKAALEVAKREGRALNGGKYEIYGVDEETLWERIDGMNDWWKDTTWTRLMHRELPDL